MPLPNHARIFSFTPLNGMVTGFAPDLFACLVAVRAGSLQAWREAWRWAMPLEPLEGFACCFCGKFVDPKQADCLRLAAIDPDNHQQWWFCHASCFKTRLDPKMVAVFGLGTQND